MAHGSCGRCERFTVNTAMQAQPIVQADDAELLDRCSKAMQLLKDEVSRVVVGRGRHRSDVVPSGPRACIVVGVPVWPRLCRFRGARALGCRWHSAVTPFVAGGHPGRTCARGGRGRVGAAAELHAGPISKSVLSTRLTDPTKYSGGADAGDAERHFTVGGAPPPPDPFRCSRHVTRSAEGTYVLPKRSWIGFPEGTSSILEIEERDRAADDIRAARISSGRRYRRDARARRARAASP